MPMVHLICGLIGSGKTTFARRLARELPALRISLDEWVMTLFGAAAPEPMTFDWWMDHCKRCSRFSWSVCEQALAGGLDVVLDCGCLVRSHRNEYRDLAHAAGAETRLYYLSAETSVRKQRVEARNRERGATFALTVTDAMFDSLDWEPPGEEELQGAVLIET